VLVSQAPVSCRALDQVLEQLALKRVAYFRILLGNAAASDSHGPFASPCLVNTFDSRVDGPFGPLVSTSSRYADRVKKELASCVFVPVPTCGAITERALGVVGPWGGVSDVKEVFQDSVVNGTRAAHISFSRSCPFPRQRRSAGRLVALFCV
jgi:hypothetical protein